MQENLLPPQPCCCFFLGAYTYFCFIWMLEKFIPRKQPNNVSLYLCITHMYNMFYFSTYIWKSKIILYVSIHKNIFTYICVHCCSIHHGHISACTTHIHTIAVPCSVSKMSSGKSFWKNKGQSLLSVSTCVNIFRFYENIFSFSIIDCLEGSFMICSTH